MDKKSKEALRRYKKARQQESSSDSSSSDSSSSSSYSSSDSEHHHRKKKSMRRASSSDEERRKREKRELCQKKLEARKQHLKRKLKEAKMRKRAALAVAALSSHSYRSLSPATQEKIKKIAEKEKLRTASKEHRDREKHKARERERARHRDSRSPSKMKIRLHQEAKRQKSPPRMHHQMMSREKIIIQTRNRDRTPSEEREARQRHEHKLRHEELLRERERRDRDRERAEREAARDKERAEALARCQERQRERERLAREKLRREEDEKKYGAGSSAGDRLLPPRTSERDLPLTRSYSSRERSLEAVERSRHLSKRELELYERDHEYLETDRRGLLERDDLRRELREYGSSRHRELSPEAYPARIRDPRELYPEEERDRSYKRAYLEEARERESWMDPREIRERESRDYGAEREPDLVYTDERERLIRDRERKMAARGEWKEEWPIPREHEWEEPGPSNRAPYAGIPKRGAHTMASGKVPSREKRPPSEQDWDAQEVKEIPPTSTAKTNENQRDWIEHDQRDVDPPQKPNSRSWQMDWREGEEAGAAPHVRPPHMYMHPHGPVRGRGGYRRGGIMDHGERNPQPGAFRPHPPPLMTLPIHHPPGPFHGNPRFPHKRPIPPYINMSVNIRKQQAQLAAAKAAAQASAVAAATTAVAAAKAAAQSAANATTNPSILGQVITGKPLLLQQLSVAQVAAIVTPTPVEDKPEAGEIISEKVEEEKVSTVAATSSSIVVGSGTEKASGELSEISDSEDDILNKMEKKPKTEIDLEVGLVKKEEPNVVPSETSSLTQTPIELPKDPIKEEPSNGVALTVLQATDKEEEVKILDFEEISDGELEEEAKHKGVGDALGVDWASLLAETKRHAESSSPNIDEHFTSAKQRWQPHHLILNLGVSMKMAGEEYVKNVLSMAKQKIDEELEQIKVKQEVKTEEAPSEGLTPPEEENSNIPMSSQDIKPPIIKQEPGTTQETGVDSPPSAIDIVIDNLHPLACVQVAERRHLLARQKMMANVCGPNSRALSARQDLQLRRQLCGLPAREFSLAHPIPPPSDKLKSLALAAFQRSLEVK